MKYAGHSDWRRVLVVVLSFLIVGCQTTSFQQSHVVPTTTPPEISQIPIADLLNRVYTTPAPDHKGVCLPNYNILVSSDYLDFITSPNQSLTQVGLDDNGIVIYNHGTGSWNFGLNYEPLMIANFGNRGVNAWCQLEDPIGLQIAINQANWLVDNAIYINDHVIWPYPFPMESYKAPAGWTSSYSNAVAIVLLTKVHALTGDQKYLETARMAVNAFGVEMEDFGVRSTEPDGSGAFYEEVSHPQAVKARILNAHLLAVEGIAMYADYTNDPYALQLVQDGIDYVYNHVAEFDASVSNVYSLTPPETRNRTNYSIPTHVEILLWMYHRTQKARFLEFALRWQNMMWPGLDADVYVPDPEISFPGKFIVSNPTDTPFDTEDKVTLIFDLHHTISLRSFGYSMQRTDVFRYPTSYTISISEDGIDWEKVVDVQDYELEHAVYLLDDVPVRYVRFHVRGSSGNGTGLYFVPIRLDTSAYWETPILIAVDNNLALPKSSYFLNDKNLQTEVTFQDAAIVYGDLRKQQLPGSLILEGSAASADLISINLQVSSDLGSWVTIVDTENDNREFPIRIDLPNGQRPWRYFRLEVRNGAKISLKEVTVN